MRDECKEMERLSGVIDDCLKSAEIRYSELMSIIRQRLENPEVGEAEGKDEAIQPKPNEVIVMLINRVKKIQNIIETDMGLACKSLDDKLSKL